jgi:hypothetical protein
MTKKSISRVGMWMIIRRCIYLYSRYENTDMVSIFRGDVGQ